jgi:hypothetical protein
MQEFSASITALAFKCPDFDISDSQRSELLFLTIRHHVVSPVLIYVISALKKEAEDPCHTFANTYCTIQRRNSEDHDLNNDCYCYCLCC